MDFTKLKEKQRKSRESAYILSEEDAEKQVFDLIQYYDIDLSFEIEGMLDDELEKELAQMSDDEKKGGNGLKQILKDVGHWVRMGVLSIETVENDLIIKHNLIKPIGQKNADSQQITDFIYESVKPKHTEKMTGLKEDKYTFSQKAELLMSYLSGQSIFVFNKLEILDKRAARDVGILLLIAQ